MPRKLPWLTDGRNAASGPTAGRPAKRQRVKTPDIEDDINSTGVGTPRRKMRGRADRTPSSSPPPQPPKEEFMREGLAADDIWIMVEDEFLDTARHFTRHLHHAEYHRLKRLARQKNASAVQKVSRPVVHRSQMSMEARQKHKADGNVERQAQALGRISQGDKGLDGDEDESAEEDAPWMQDAQLAGLMSGSQREPSDRLARLTGTKSNTRAAAGYAVPKPPSITRLRDVPKRSSAVPTIGRTMMGLAQEIEKVVADDDSDDLDGSSLRKSARKELGWHLSTSTTRAAKAREPSTQLPTKPLDHVRSSVAKSHTTSTSTFVRPTGLSHPNMESRSSSRGAVTRPPTTISLESSRRAMTSKSDISEDLPRRSVPPPGLAERIAKRKAEMAANKGSEEKKSISLDEIPTFMI